ncbi:CrcB family protein [Halobacillus sp. A5]|uniref:fluoride efflux transporter FluC n=1 Tax=Halobacillus sp. A5 TaxID=2880263 RepID=UPI0020A684FA|nr:CrcB family protein [Halobacillus sp. A5]MCP3027198.1 CrcB family protein [Halobacillus sp. A5]
MIYIWVGAAGFMGAVLRYALGVLFYDADAFFPFSTLTANLTGSFLLAWFTFELIHRFSLSKATKSAIGTGFIGSFTTFSTLSVETVTLMNQGSVLLASVYVLVSIIGGLILSHLGYSLGARRRAG